MSGVGVTLEPGTPAGGGVPATLFLPELRDDLGLFPAPRNSRGEASWTLHDPVRNRYFRLGTLEFEMLTRWRAGAPVTAMISDAAAAGVVLHAEEIAAFAEFLQRNELLQGDAAIVRRLLASHKARQQTLWQKLLHNYLFLRVPLVRPDPWLDRWYPLVRPLLSRRFFQITALVGLLGIVLVLRQWDLFLSTFIGFISWEGAAAFGITLALVKVLHEGGHALACRHFGLRVPSIGVAFIVMWPVMYTDATEAWRLTSRRSRVTIAAAGMMTELTIACYATLLWTLLPDGLLRGAVFLLATTTWIMSLAVNLNPLMKFDGYYLFADMLDIPNLQDRGFELARNRMRSVLFGIPKMNDPGLLPGEQRIAIVWAYATWIYRFVLFLGIAVLVYTFFFKALGIFLFLVEIWWFIAAPIWREIRNWRGLAMRLDSRRRRGYLFGGAAALLLLVVPWESSFLAPGMLKAGEQQQFFAVAPSGVQGAHVENGARVQRGDVLFELDSPDLDARLAAARAEMLASQHELTRVMSGIDTANDRLVAEGDLARARSAVMGLEQSRERLRVVAPFSGLVRDVPRQMRAGLWVSDKQPLGRVISEDGGIVVDAYITEDYLRFVNAGDEARFYPEDPTVSPLDGIVEHVDRVDARILSELALVEAHGGSIPARMDDKGNAVPEQAIYRVRARLQERGAPERELRGQLRLTGDTRSLLTRAGTFLAGAVLRESGF